jgi:hypothetical protein
VRVVDWLLDSDPSIRWQVMRDLTDVPVDAIAAERARVASEGWGARLLALQRANGGWSDIANPQAYIESQESSANYALLMLRSMGVDPTSDEQRRAIARVRDNLTHFEGGQPFFAGEVEACINGRVLGAGAYFGEPSESLLQRLLDDQLADGGWNCYAPPSQRSSFHSTICVLEGLLEYEMSQGASDEVTEARHRGHEYLLERRMFRSLSTGEVINQDWTRFALPFSWHYDVLRGLDYLRSAGVDLDDRAEEAIDLVRMHRGEDGRWPLQIHHALPFDFDMGEDVGRPSRWNTLRALRVLRWAEDGKD